MIKILNLKLVIIAKGCSPSWFEQAFMIKNVKNTVPLRGNM